jgi:hypothetical protein
MRSTRKKRPVTRDDDHDDDKASPTQLLSPLLNIYFTQYWFRRTEFVVV